VRIFYDYRVDPNKGVFSKTKEAACCFVQWDEQHTVLSSLLGIENKTERRSRTVWKQAASLLFKNMSF